MSDKNGNILEIQGITKSYKSNVAVDNFSVTMKSGIYGLLGPNGSGKSTLMKCIADVIRADSGKILYNGENICDMKERFRAVLGYMPQDIGFYPNFTAYQTLEYFATLKDISLSRAEAEKALSQVNLADVKNKKVREFSGGMKRRLAIAVTMLNSPEVIIFDEATAGLDPEERIRFKQLLQNLSQSKIIILATHIISDLEALCDEILFIRKGKLVHTEKMDKSKQMRELDGIESRYSEIFGDENE